jgi:hypothetical protein
VGFDQTPIRYLAVDPQHESTILLFMSKRLQVLLDEQEFEELQEIARQIRMTVAEWVH